MLLAGLTNAHSLAFKNGYLYIATTPAVMRVKWASGKPSGAPEKFAELPTSTPSLHVTRTINFGPDGRLYVAIGSSCNVCVEADPRRATIQVINATADVTPAAAVPPLLELPAHSTGMDLRFYRGTQFPAPYRGALFLALHGSSRKTNGYKVVRVVVTDGRPIGLEDFATGWLKNGIVMGRPAGLASGADGALYVSDDNKGFIYRIAYVR